MRKVFGVFKETVMWVLGFDGKKRRWAVDNGLCDFSGQGRDKYGKLGNGLLRGDDVYKCIECRTVFDDPKTWEESRGEFWGFPCNETMSGCPECEGDYEEAFKCQRCGEWYFEDELNDGLCEDCRDELFD